MASLVGKAGRVHAFEPNPSRVELLRQAIVRNSLKNVTLHATALGSEPGRLELRIPKLNAGAASLVRNVDLECEVVKVPVEQLDAVIAREKIESIRLVKIDVEGYEAGVLKGADVLLRNARPDTILFELNDYIDGVLTDIPVIKVLLQYDYRFLAIPRALVRMKLQHFDPRTAIGLPGHDFIAVAPGKPFENTASALNAQT
jgi:FkbM family methyltransferase